MHRIQAIARRDFLSYYKSPIGYVILAIFVLVNGFLFSSNLLSYRYADVGGQLMAISSILFLIIIPLMTMRTFSEERRNGTETLLLTSPASVAEVVIGKYLGTLYMFLTMTASSLIFLVITVLFDGNVDIKILGSYIGFIFLGAAYLAIGVFASSVTENQVIAAVITFSIIFGLMLADGIASIAGSMMSTFLGNVNLFGLTDLQLDKIGQAITDGLRWPNPTTRLANLESGIFELSPLLFFLSLAALFLFLTGRIIEKRRWSQK